MEFNGFRLTSSAIDAASQARLVDEILAGAKAAPFYRPMTPSGKPMSVEQTSFGSLGWVTDQRGYRYEPNHPLTGRPWPPMPRSLLALWALHAGDETWPDSCLVNLYRTKAKMGLHTDSDEEDLTAPVLSVSLGDTAIFRLGGAARGDPSRTVRLNSGDVGVLAGPSRRFHHGVDRIVAGSSRLVPGGGRINLTLRRAKRP
ncbi:MAG TPA: alpha-ketoglutarate-dependent dioxygenase AlkB [Caulobacteraceae bacterium]|nr:alpha-ketoglutarate-dependent dioxygenase AlkB [Caulobacteraceae bacterium]